MKLRRETSAFIKMHRMPLALDTCSLLLCLADTENYNLADRVSLRKAEKGESVSPKVR